MYKILVVDDSQVARGDMASILEEGGHEVAEAEDGAVGLKILKESEDIDLVITDFNMPNMDGIAMAKAIHEIPRYERIPIFMLTTETSTELKARGKEAGVMLWIVKPPVHQKVLDAIHHVLQKQKASV
jgi:two-component system chemotaxis response regulator CheY